MNEDLGQEEKGTAEDDMVGWYQWLSGHIFEYTPGDSERQGNLQDAAGPGLQRVGHDYLATKQHGLLWTFLVAQIVKNLPAVQET